MKSPIEFTTTDAFLNNVFSTANCSRNKEKKKKKKKKGRATFIVEGAFSLTFAEVKVQRSWSNRFAITLSALSRGSRFASETRTLRPIHTGFAYLCDHDREIRVYLVRCFTMRHAGG